MEKRPTVYIETTVPSYIFNDRYPEKQKVAKKLFDLIKRGRFEAYVSSTVIKELQAASEPRRSELVKLIKGIKSLPETEAAKSLTEKYLKEKIFPAKKRFDAAHVAIASVHGIDILLSWNFDHIVRLQTKRKVEAVNTLLGFKTPAIATPEEVI